MESVRWATSTRHYVCRYSHDGCRNYHNIFDNYHIFFINYNHDDNHDDHIGARLLRLCVVRSLD